MLTPRVRYLVEYVLLRTECSDEARDIVGDDDDLSRIGTLRRLDLHLPGNHGNLQEKPSV